MGNLFYLLILGILWLNPPVADGETVTLTVQLRAIDGASLGGEIIILERLPDAAAISPACQTNQGGLCTWRVTRGLYQVRFPAYTLDDLSALALAEGGMSGLGVTVGEAAIRYAFTVQEDGHVYFDATPDAAAPTPRLPTETDLAGGVFISPVVRGVTEPTTTSTLVTQLPEPEKTTPFRAWWLWPGAGVTLGFMIWFIRQYWSRVFGPATTRW